MMRSMTMLFAACFALAGCATSPQFPEPDQSWQTYNGQLQYITADNRVIGEFEASRRGEDFSLQFTKGGAVPLIRVTRHEQYARAEGALARGRWQGTIEKAPAALRGWVDAVPRGFSQKTTPGGSPQRIEIPGSQPGERFIFVFVR